MFDSEYGSIHTYIYEIYNALTHSQGWLESEAQAFARYLAPFLRYLIFKTTATLKSRSEITRVIETGTIRQPGYSFQLVS